jgi:hypothetical protein
VPFITEEGGVAYRDINAIIVGLRREDKIMSVDVEKYKSGGRTGLVFGSLTNMRRGIQLEFQLGSRSIQ